LLQRFVRVGAYSTKDMVHIGCFAQMADCQRWIRNLKLQERVPL